MTLTEHDWQLALLLSTSFTQEYFQSALSKDKGTETNTAGTKVFMTVSEEVEEVQETLISVH